MKQLIHLLQSSTKLNVNWTLTFSLLITGAGSTASFSEINSRSSFCESSTFGSSLILISSSVFISGSSFTTFSRSVVSISIFLWISLTVEDSDFLMCPGFDEQDTSNEGENNIGKEEENDA